MPSNSPHLQCSVDGSVAVVTLLDEQLRNPEVVNQVKDAMIEAIRGTGCRNVVIDLGRVTFIGSVGFLAFLAVRRIADIENVVLCNLTPNIRQMFGVSRLIPTDLSPSAPFQVADSLTLAIEKCGKRPT